jgi:hypothetical protein
MNPSKEMPANIHNNKKPTTNKAKIANIKVEGASEVEDSVQLSAESYSDAHNKGSI